MKNKLELQSVSYQTNWTATRRQQSNSCFNGQ